MLSARIKQRRMLRHLRADLGIGTAGESRIPDSEMLAMSEGWVTRSSVEMRLAWWDIYQALRKDWKRIRVLLGRKP